MTWQPSDCATIATGAATAAHFVEQLVEALQDQPLRLPVRTQGQFFLVLEAGSIREAEQHQLAQAFPAQQRAHPLEDRALVPLQDGLVVHRPPRDAIPRALQPCAQRHDELVVEVGRGVAHPVHDQQRERGGHV